MYQANRKTRPFWAFFPRVEGREVVVVSVAPCSLRWIQLDLSSSENGTWPS